MIVNDSQLLRFRKGGYRQPRVIGIKPVVVIIVAAAAALLSDCRRRVTYGLTVNLQDNCE